MKIITPNDEVIIVPQIGGNAPSNVIINDPRANEIINKVNNILNSGSQKKSWSFLTELERIYLLNYYKGLTSGLYQVNEWSPNSPSPYAPHLKVVIDELVFLLYYLEMIERRTYKAVEDIVFHGVSTRFTDIKHRLIRKEQGNNFKIGEETIDKWFIRIEKKINEIYKIQLNKPKSEYNIGLQMEKEYKLCSVNEFFGSIYSLFGFNRENRFYRYARLMLLKIGETLRLTPLTSFINNNFQNLGGFIERNIDYLYTNLAKNPNRIPNRNSIIKLEYEIKRTLQSIIEFSISKKENIINEIHGIIQQYLTKIQDYLKRVDLLENLPEGPRKQLLQDIIHYPYNIVLEAIQDQIILSQLLFGDEVVNNQIGNFMKFGKKDLSTLFQMKLSVEQWTLKTFQDLNLEISRNVLIDLKIFIQKIIDDYIFNNPEYDYISENTHRFGVFHSKNFMRREYETIYNIWRAFAIKSGSVKTSFKALTEELKIGRGLTDKLRGDTASFNIGIGTLKKYLNKIQEFLNSENDIRKREIHQEAIDSIKNYAADRHLGFQFYQQIKDIKGTYNRIWFKNWYKSIQIIIGLANIGGINPLTCEPIEPTLFDGDRKTQGGVYQPHHFSIREKHLLLLGRTFIFNQHWHSRFNILAKYSMGVQLQIQLRDAVLSLMDSEKKVIDETDIKQAFGDLNIFGKKVSDFWIGHDDYRKNIAQFNRNRELIKQGKIYEFIKDNFEIPNKGNAILDKYWKPMIQTISGFLMLYDDFSFSYLFTQRDMEFIKQVFKLESILS